MNIQILFIENLIWIFINLFKLWNVSVPFCFVRGLQEIQIILIDHHGKVIICRNYRQVQNNWNCSMIFFRTLNNHYELKSRSSSCITLIHSPGYAKRVSRLVNTIYSTSVQGFEFLNILTSKINLKTLFVKMRVW